MNDCYFFYTSCFGKKACERWRMADDNYVTGALFALMKSGASPKTPALQFTTQCWRRPCYTGVKPGYGKRRMKVRLMQWKWGHVNHLFKEGNVNSTNKSPTTSPIVPRSPVGLMCKERDDFKESKCDFRIVTLGARSSLPRENIKLDQIRSYFGNDNTKNRKEFTFFSFKSHFAIWNECFVTTYYPLRTMIQLQRQMFIIVAPNFYRC